MTVVKLQPGDIVAVRTPGGFPTPQWWIRFGAALQNKPNLDNHVALMHHYDSSGVPWGLQGQPGGVGWVDMRQYIASPYTINNCGQPDRPDIQRADVSWHAKALLGTKYDWAAIANDGLDDLHVKLWNLQFPHGQKPGEVVCSSFAAYLYGAEGWAHPDTGTERMCQPADWTDFCVRNGYSLPLR